MRASVFDNLKLAARLTSNFRWLYDGLLRKSCHGVQENHEVIRKVIKIEKAIEEYNEDLAPKGIIGLDR